MNRQQYIGAIPHLRGRVAQLRPRESAPGEVMAQFEDFYLRESWGWWQFSANEFATLAQQ